MCRDAIEFLGNSFADSGTKVSLILSGGADLAVFFQLGAINVLHDHVGMRPEKLHLIAGGSGGSISGLLTAGGVNSDKPGIVPPLEEVLKKDKKNKRTLERLGVYSQDGVVAHIEGMLGDSCRRFRDLPVDLRIASTMVLPNLRKVVFSRKHCRLNGREVSTYDAMKCSITVPFLYTPVKIGNGPLNRSYHLDGEIIRPVPVEEGRDSDVMVVVSVYSPYRGFLPPFDLHSKWEHRLNRLLKFSLEKRIQRIKKHNPDLEVIVIENDPFDYQTATFRKFSMKNVEQLKAAGRHAAWQCSWLN